MKIYFTWLFSTTDMIFIIEIIGMSFICLPQTMRIGHVGKSSSFLHFLLLYLNFS